MMNSNDLVNTIKKIAIAAVMTTKPTAIRFGKVISTDPLKINVEQKMTLTDAQLILTRNVKDHTTKISFDNPGIKQVFTTWDMGETVESSPSKIAFKTKTQHEITVYNGLKVGESVIMISMQGGQKYIVWDRI